MGQVISEFIDRPDVGREIPGLRIEQWRVQSRFLSTIQCSDGGGKKQMVKGFCTGNDIPVVPLAAIESFRESLGLAIRPCSANLRLFSKQQQANTRVLDAFFDTCQLIYEQLRQLRRCPNCLPYTGIRKVQGDRTMSIYFTRAFAPFTVPDVLSRAQPTVFEKLWISYQMVQAVAQCHALGIAHSNIKVDNFLVAPSGWVYLVDFAPYCPASVPADNPVLFTFFFDCPKTNQCSLAPERIDTGARPNSLDKTPLDNDGLKAADIFSLALALIQVWTNLDVRFTLFDITSYRDRVPVAVFERAFSIIPPAIQSLIEPMLDVDPSCRPTAATVLENPIWPSCFPWLHAQLAVLSRAGSPALSFYEQSTHQLLDMIRMTETDLARATRLTGSDWSSRLQSLVNHDQVRQRSGQQQLDCLNSHNSRHAHISSRPVSPLGKTSSYSEDCAPCNVSTIQTLLDGVVQDVYRELTNAGFPFIDLLRKKEPVTPAFVRDCESGNSIYDQASVCALMSHFLSLFAAAHPSRQMSALSVISELQSAMNPSCTFSFLVPWILSLHVSALSRQNSQGTLIEMDPYVIIQVLDILLSILRRASVLRAPLHLVPSTLILDHLRFLMTTVTHPALGAALLRVLPEMISQGQRILINQIYSELNHAVLRFASDNYNAQIFMDWDNETAEQLFREHLSERADPSDPLIAALAGDMEPLLAVARGHAKNCADKAQSFLLGTFPKIAAHRVFIADGFHRLCEMSRIAHCRAQRLLRTALTCLDRLSLSPSMERITTNTTVRDIPGRHGSCSLFISGESCARALIPVRSEQFLFSLVSITEEAPRHTLRSTISHVMPLIIEGLHSQVDSNVSAALIVSVLLLQIPEIQIQPFFSLLPHIIPCLCCPLSYIRGPALLFVSDLLKLCNRTQSILLGRQLVPVLRRPLTFVSPDNLYRVLLPPLPFKLWCSINKEVWTQPNCCIFTSGQDTPLKLLSPRGAEETLYFDHGQDDELSDSSDDESNYQTVSGSLVHFNRVNPECMRGLRLAPAPVLLTEETTAMHPQLFASFPLLCSLRRGPIVPLLKSRMPQLPLSSVKPLRDELPMGTTLFLDNDYLSRYIEAQRVLSHTLDTQHQGPAPQYPLPPEERAIASPYRRISQMIRVAQCGNANSRMAALSLLDYAAEERVHTDIPNGVCALHTNAHSGAVTGLHMVQGLIVTTGTDGYLRLFTTRDTGVSVVEGTPAPLLDLTQLLSTRLNSPALALTVSREYLILSNSDGVSFIRLIKNGLDLRFSEAAVAPMKSIASSLAVISDGDSGRFPIVAAAAETSIWIHFGLRLLKRIDIPRRCGPITAQLSLHFPGFASRYLVVGTALGCILLYNLPSQVLVRSWRITTGWPILSLTQDTTHTACPQLDYPEPFVSSRYAFFIGTAGGVVLRFQAREGFITDVFHCANGQRVPTPTIEELTDVEEINSLSNTTCFSDLPEPLVLSMSLERDSEFLYIGTSDGRTRGWCLCHPELSRLMGNVYGCREQVVLHEAPPARPMNYTEQLQGAPLSVNYEGELRFNDNTSGGIMLTRERDPLPPINPAAITALCCSGFILAGDGKGDIYVWK